MLCPMTPRIAFIDETCGDYTPETPRRRPLGGTQSAVCYLAEALAAAGASVTIVNGTGAVETVRGVECRPARATPPELLGDADLLVVAAAAGEPLLRRLRAALRPGGRLVLWAHHAADQPSVAGLADPELRGLWDGFAFVSRWQMEAYVGAFGIDPARCRVLRNAVAPMFEGLFAPGEGILPAKPWPPVLAYASTPFRGLDVLLDSLPAIRAAIPGTALRVFSSLEGYQVPGERDPFADLYRRCRETPGVTYAGGVSQAGLAGQLREATCLAYPNRFPETSCIAVMEAMAAGCLVVSSRLGALPETGAGFARLIPVPADPALHARHFAEAAVAALGRLAADRNAAERALRAQVDHAGASLGWAARARAWLDWLAELAGKDDRRQSAGRAPATPADLVRRAREILAADGDHAGTLCRAALALDPCEAEAWRLVVRGEAALGAWVPAAAALARAWRAGGRRPHPEADALWARVLAAIAEGGDGASAEERIAAAGHLARLAAAGGTPAQRDELAAVAGRLAGAAIREGRFEAALGAYALLLGLRPGDARVLLARAWPLTRLGRHGDAVEAVRLALHADAHGLLAGPEARSLAQLCLDEAETAALASLDADPAAAAPAAAGLYRAMAGIARRLGEEARFLDAAAAAAEAAAAGDTGAAALAQARAAAVVGRRRSRQGRHEEAVERLGRAAAADPGAGAALVTAGLSQAQHRLVEALGNLLRAGIAGTAAPGWREEARSLVALAEGSLRLAHSDEARRTSLWAAIRGFDARLAHWEAEAEMPPPAPPPPGGRRLFDCFQFNDELDLLEVRLAELAGVVYRFVLVEAAFTHAGAPKPLHYAENRERFAAFADRIVHVVVADDPGGFAWEREAHQREAILRGLGECGPTDMILVSDADEIPRAETVAALRHDAGGPPGLLAPQLELFLYFLDLASPEPWVSMAAAPWELMRRLGPNRARYLAKQGIGRPLAGAGWHFTWMGGLERYLAKQAAYAHREMEEAFAGDAAANRARLERFYATGTFAAGAAPGMWTSLARTTVDGRYPAAIRDRLDRFRSMGWLAPDPGGG